MPASAIAARIAATSLAVLALAACSPPPEYFQISNAVARWYQGGVVIVIQQALVLPDEAREALRNGVPITLRVDAALHPAGDQVARVRDSERYEIRYLPLSEHYQLTRPRNAMPETYPRLRHVLAALQRVELPLATDAGADGDWELRVRTHIDIQRLPAPMRLPALFSREWHLDSQWSTWPVPQTG